MGLLEDVAGELDVVHAVATVEDDGVDLGVGRDAERVVRVGRAGRLFTAPGGLLLAAATTGGAGGEGDAEGNGGRGVQTAAEDGAAVG